MASISACRGRLRVRAVEARAPRLQPTPVTLSGRKEHEDGQVMLYVMEAVRNACWYVEERSGRHSDRLATDGCLRPAAPDEVHLVLGVRVLEVVGSAANL